MERPICSSSSTATQAGMRDRRSARSPYHETSLSRLRWWYRWAWSASTAAETTSFDQDSCHRPCRAPSVEPSQSDEAAGQGTSLAPIRSGSSEDFVALDALLPRDALQLTPPGALLTANQPSGPHPVSHAFGETQHPEIVVPWLLNPA